VPAFVAALIGPIDKSEKLSEKKTEAIRTLFNRSRIEE
jgi:hypothetical protein